MSIPCLVEGEYSEITIKEAPVNKAVVFPGMHSCHCYSSTNLQLPDFERGSTIKVNSFIINIKLHVDNILEGKLI